MLAIILPPCDRTQDLLKSAQQKLRATDVPPLLRMTAFIRLSCLAMDKPGAYSQVMQRLCCYPNWWLTCEVTAAGTLVSSNPDINRVLQPIQHLHYPQVLPAAA